MHARLKFVSVSLLPLLAALACAVEAEEADRPLPPQEAALSMQVPEGFHVSLFAGEPDVRQPIGFCLDDRGRLWVAEAYNYPVHGTRAGDRIVILEDADGDGRFDKRTVFYDKLNYVTGIEVGFGGAWVMSPPYFYFIPDRDGDDRPDAAPRVLLDGFGNHANSHNLANGFAWGPDGWLYGTHGRTNYSWPAKPGTPQDQREQFDGGVYRYHPVRHVWEPFADGTTNPWGIDWDDYGEAFVCNCVNPHLFHVMQGAHYEPWRGRESSQYAYQRIDTIADHLHFVGKNNVRDGIGSAEEDAVGGGHAHCGTMVYLGDNWPARYRNTVFMNNIHGKRINNDILKRRGSGYIATHGSDVMRSKDPWYMGVTLCYGARRRSLCQRLVGYRRMPQHQKHPPRDRTDLQDHLRRAKDRGDRHEGFERPPTCRAAVTRKRLARPPRPPFAARARRPRPRHERSSRTVACDVCRAERISPPATRTLGAARCRWLER